MKIKAKKWKNLDNLLEILSKIDKDKENPSDANVKKEDFNFPFGDDTDNPKTTEFLEQIAEFINNNYEKVERMHYLIFLGIQKLLRI